MRKQTARKLESFKAAALPKSQQMQVKGGNDEAAGIIVIDSVDT